MVLISRVLVQYVTELKRFGHVVPMHIPHERSAAMAKMSDTVSILFEFKHCTFQYNGDSTGPNPMHMHICSSYKPLLRAAGKIQ